MVAAPGNPRLGLLARHLLRPKAVAGSAMSTKEEPGGLKFYYYPQSSAALRLKSGTRGCP